MDTTNTKGNGDGNESRNVESVSELIAQVDDGDKNAQRLFHEILKEGVFDIDMSEYAKDSMLSYITGDKKSTTIAIKWRMSEMTKRLSESDDTPLIQMLIDNVVTVWTMYQDVFRRYSAVTSESIPLTRARYWEDKLTKAHDRYLKAVRELNRARKMLRPMQITAVGMNQINIGKSSPVRD